MAGFENDIVFSKNADFTQADNQAPTEANGLATNGQLWIGTTALNAGSTHINVGSITSPDLSVVVGYSSPNITLTAAGLSPTTFTGDTGTANPVMNNVNIFGASTAAGTDPVFTTAAVDTVTINVQRSQAVAATDATTVGLSNFNSSQFSVDVNGFVSLVGAGQAIDSIGVQTGTNPITPTAGGLVTINGAVVAAGTNPVRSDGTGANTMALEVQISQAIVATNATNIGLSAFDSAAFDVDANGFVQLNGGGIATSSFDVQANTAPGTDPVVPTAAGVVVVNGAAVANHSVVLETRSRAANTYNLEVQYAATAAGSDATKSGVSHYNSAQFTIDASGFVGLKGSASNPGILGVHPNTTSGAGTDPTIADASGNISILGSTVAAGTNPIRTVATAANSLTTQVQFSQAISATDSTKVGLSNFDSAAFDVDANGFVQLNGGGIAATSFDVQANTAPGTDPVVPTVAGLVTINGAAVANHSVVLETRSRAANAYNLEVQYGTSAAATDATKSGVAHFNSAQFTVDANGFVSTSGTGIPNTITGDSGGALSPTAGNWNILGGPGVTTSGSGSTLTINSVVFTDTTAITLVSDNGYFATAAGTYPMPATAAQGELIHVVCDTAGAVVLDCPAANFIRVGNQITSSGGTATSNSIGDSLTLRYRLSSLTWEATSIIGTWTLA